MNEPEKLPTQPTPEARTPQQYMVLMEDIKASMKLAGEKLEATQKEFVAKFGAFEYPVIAQDGSAKWFRIYEPEGHFVYNRKFEIGLRAKPVSPAPGMVK